MKIITASFYFLLIIAVGCKNKSQQEVIPAVQDHPTTEELVQPVETEIDEDLETIHVLVALCDNKYQGIVPVPATIGNGQDARNNLYWGTAYGIKTYFKRSKEWNLLKTEKVNEVILERAIFKHATKAVYLIAGFFIV